jgi:hypothetical protein
VRAPSLGDALAELILEPPIEVVGALPVEAFLSPKRRADLAADLNTLVASPSFAAWRRAKTSTWARGWRAVDGKTPATIVSVAHLDDEERRWSSG